MTEMRRLHGSGWVGWSTVRERLEGLTCAWVDWSGMHVGLIPEDPPRGLSHLWAWSQSSLHRVRVDGADAVMATLGDVEWECPLEQDVPVLVQPAATWREPHVRTEAGVGSDWQVVEVLSGSAMTFIRPLG